MTLLHKRQTGRTQRMIEQAQELAAKGRAVYIIAATKQQRDDIEQRIAPNPHGIKVEIPAPKNFDWQTMRLIGAHPNCVTLVDHYAIERGFGALLTEWMRYDP